MDIKIDASIEPKGERKKRFSAQEKLLILSEITKDRSIEDVAEDYSKVVGFVKTNFFKI